MVCGYGRSLMRGRIGCGVFSRHGGESLYLPGLWNSSSGGNLILSRKLSAWEDGNSDRSSLVES